jgi:hypothetical protein
MFIAGVITGVLGTLAVVAGGVFLFAVRLFSTINR